MRHRVHVGPFEAFHPGVHVPIVKRGVPGYSLHPSNVTHTFVHPSGARPPLNSPDWGEFADFGAAPLVHSVSLPVVGSSRWVVDLDDVGSMLFIGRYGFRRGFDATESRLASRSPAYLIAQRRRIDNIVAALCHGSCASIMFRCQRERHQAIATIAALRGEVAARSVDSKSIVVYPAVTCATGREVTLKWQGVHTPEIVFCGMDVAKKNGAMALRIMSRLAKKHPHVRATYIGTPPASHTQGCRDGVAIHERLSQAEVIAIMRRSHILLHPAKSESFGVVLLEAAAMGMAAVVGAGHGMEQVVEIFGQSEGATYVERPLSSPDDEERCFERATEALVLDVASARAMALRNLRVASTGTLSVAQQCRRLQDAYGAARQSKAAPLKLSDLPHFPGVASQMSTARLNRMLKAETGQRRPYGVWSVEVEREDVGSDRMEQR